MFCSECGTQVSDNANFCFNCGAKINASSENQKDVKSKQTIGDKEAVYLHYIKKEILKVYEKDKTLSPDVFYSKAQYYNLDESHTKALFERAVQEIQQFVNFIEELYKESPELDLPDNLMDELINYANANNIEEDTCLDFLEHYNKVNELLEKRKILEYLIDTFCETGHFDENIPTYLTQLKSTSFETLFEQYKTAIINALAEIDKQYKQNNEIYSLSEEQYSLLSHMATKTIFLSEDIPKLIMGYEKQTGLCEKKDQIRIEKVRKNIDDSYSVTYTLFGHDVKFDAKYFVLRDIDETSKNAETNYLNKLKKSKASSTCDVAFIGKLLQKYADELYVDMEHMEKLFDNDFSDMQNIISNKFENLAYDLDDLYTELEELYLEKELTKQERAYRKEMRGRWEGGGFGVGGAIKGAVTAGAMNAVEGGFHSAANLIGNTFTSIATHSSARSKIDIFCNKAESVLSSISALLYDVWYRELKQNYPELDYMPDYRDTEEDKKLRKDFLNCNTNKCEKAIHLLLANPYNPVNAFTIYTYYQNKQRSFWTKETDGEFSLMIDEFSWIENLEKVVSKYEDIVKKLLKEDSKNEISNMDVLNTYCEFIKFLKSKAELNKETQGTYDQCLEKIEYVTWLQKIDSADVSQILKKGNDYLSKKKLFKAENTFLASVKKSETAQNIVKAFFNNGDKAKIIETLVNFIKEESINSDEYNFIMQILAQMENENGETLLMYAATFRYRALVDELIKHNADINKLYQLVGQPPVKDNNSTANEQCQYITCNSCGKQLNSNAKFCNYCGHKI